METTEKKSITVETTVNSSLENVWNLFTDAKHIVNWYNASPDWHAPFAENDLRTGGKFKTTMAAKDGSMSFDFIGDYTNVIDHKLIESTLGDGRKMKIVFSSHDK